MRILFPDFKDIEFPHDPDIVYIIYFRRKEDEADIPFYVGESSRNIGRFGDYVSARFSAPTDFKVGEAIKYFRSLGFYVGIKYKKTQTRKDEETLILNDLRKHYDLLNDLPGYAYLRSNEADEKLKVHEFVRHIIDKTSKEKHQELDDQSP